LSTSLESPAKALRKLFRATKVSFHWWGQRRQVEKSIRSQMASAVEADPDSISATKRLYNPKIKAIAEINQLKTAIGEYWELSTRPWPDPGIRLLLRTDLEAFEAKMQESAIAIQEAAHGVQEARPEIIADARQRLRGAFSEGNYPLDLASLFSIEWAYPSIDPPHDLPEQVYAQQKQAVEAKLQEAVALAEQAFLKELSELVQTLHDRLTPGPDGQKKVFRDSAVNNVVGFFDRFKKLHVGGSADLETLVEEAKQLVVGVLPGDLRRSQVLRQEVQQGLSSLKDKLTPLVIPMPRRRIIAPKKLHGVPA
jgi:hypothetical protein